VNITSFLNWYFDTFAILRGTDILNATEHRDGRIRERVAWRKSNRDWRMVAATSYEATSQRCEEKESICIKVPPNFADSLNHNPQIPSQANSLRNLTLLMWRHFAAFRSSIVDRYFTAPFVCQHVMLDV